MPSAHGLAMVLILSLFPTVFVAFAGLRAVRENLPLSLLSGNFSGNTLDMLSKSLKVAILCWGRTVYVHTNVRLAATSL